MKYIWIISLIFISSCRIIDKCERTEVSNSVDASFTREISLGEKAKIDLEFGIGNGCGSFKEIKTTETGRVLYIEVINAFSGCTCTELYQMGSGTLYFEPKEKGEYYIQYLNKPNTLKTDTLLVK